MKLPADIDAALYCELINRRPSEPDALRMQWGPTEQFRLLKLQRLAWAVSTVAASTTDRVSEAS